MKNIIQNWQNLNGKQDNIKVWHNEQQLCVPLHLFNIQFTSYNLFLSIMLSFIKHISKGHTAPSALFSSDYRHKGRAMPQTPISVIYVLTDTLW